MKQSKRILLIFTGGTICSVFGRNGKNRSDAKKTQSYLVDHYEKSDSPFARSLHFDDRSLSRDVLSENMTGAILYELLSIFKDEKNIEENYAGVIVLHGTDTLAYTSSFLSFALAGLSIPVCLVSAQLPLKRKRKITQNGRTKTVNEDDPHTNGYANFRAAVELIMNGIAPNVYAVYKNKTGELLVHLGSHLLQCPNASDDFHSRDEVAVPDPHNAALAGIPFESNNENRRRAKQPVGDVLLIQPHTNLNYQLIGLDSSLAVIHGTYHSQSVCIGRTMAEKDGQKKESCTLDMIKEEDRPYSILSLLMQCKKREIPLFLAPCNQKSYRYSTTANALKCGAVPLPDLTLESAYAKALFGIMLGKRGRALTMFMRKSINYEFCPIAFQS